ncbi:hypothetical protein LCGC14_1857480, partial [marine sediment metagenome]
MAAVNITSGNNDDNVITNGRRVAVRNSSGIPYVIVENQSDDSIDVWKGNSATPTSFTEQDNTNNPSGTVYGSCSAAIDFGGIIHIAYMQYNGKTSAFRYVTFNTSTDTFSGDVAVDTDIGSDPTSISNLYTAIAIDTANIPHVVYTRSEADMGTDFLTATYRNRIGGSWSSLILVSTTATNADAVEYDITINSNNLPMFSYLYKRPSMNITAVRGNANNPGFFIQAIISADNISEIGPSMAVDSNGDEYVVFQGTSGIQIRKHIKNNPWPIGNWETIQTVSSSTAGTLSLVIDGTDLYVFAEDANNDIVYYKSTNYTSWDSAVNLETGTYNTVIAKWARWIDIDSSGTNRGGGGSRIELDYVFTDETATPDILWNKLSIGATEVDKTFTVDAFLQATETIKHSLLMQ